MTKKPDKTPLSFKINCQKTFGFECSFDVFGFEEINI
jgi:hypothetical protein